MRPLLRSRALRFVVSLLTLACGLSVPVRSQSSSLPDDGGRIQRSTLEPSLFTPDAGNILASYEELLGARGLIDLLPEWCPGNHGIAAEKKKSTEWFCSDVPNPEGFPGGGTSYLRFFGDDEKLFALVALFKDDDPSQLAMVQSQLVRSFQKLCPCRFGENGVTYCHCENVELRLMQQGRGLGIMVIDDVERFMAHTLGLESPSKQLEPSVSEDRNKTKTEGGQ